MPAKFDTASLPDFPDLSFELALWEQKITRLGGVDEAGRGALAGPVAAAVVILPADPDIGLKLHGVRDSKQMTVSQRETWEWVIKASCLAWGVGFASAGEIDAIGILPATRLAVFRAVETLDQAPQHLITDYLLLPDLEIPQTSLVKGDRRSLSVACASVLAKTSRDACMRVEDGRYPAYHLAQHKGYGTRAHRNAILEHGLSPLHRVTFRVKP